MADQEGGGSGRSCFKYGCLGCIALLVIGLVAGGSIVAVALLLGPPEKVTERPQLVRQLPSSLQPVPGSVSSDRGEGELPVGELVPLEAAAGRIVLDLTEGSFRIVPGDPGTPILVDGQYDAGTYELTESLEDQGESGWIYRVTFRRQVSWIRALFHEDEGDNRLTLTIPRGIPFVLEGSIGVGESILELGGLSILDTDLQLGTGSHDLRFGEEQYLPMQRFALAATIGELRVSGLGDASPESVSVRHRIGEVDIDLRGSWRRDASVALRCGIGECLLRLPEDVAVEVDEASVGVGETDMSDLARLPPPEAGVPTLRLELSGKVGEVRVSR